MLIQTEQQPAFKASLAKSMNQKFRELDINALIANLKKINPDINYLSVGGENLKSIGIQSIYDLKEITYLGFTNVLLNLFKINKRINQTIKAVIDYNPDILFTVDSPDFTLRVAERVKKINSKIKTVHYVAPQLWIWRESRVKKIMFWNYQNIHLKDCLHETVL